MDKYGLIGFPLGHSFSEGFFNQKFYSEGIDACYVNYEIADIAEFKHILQDNPNLKGMNVTIPYKEKVIKYLDELAGRREDSALWNWKSTFQYWRSACGIYRRKW